MPCTAPLDAWRTETGIQFKQPKDRSAKFSPPLKLPCRNCIGCKVDRSKEWMVRIMHEASLHSENCFITLTYNNENLPEDEGLHHEHFQTFFQALRRNYNYHTDKKIKMYMCGEYGEQLGRPHYHAIIFNYRPHDLIKQGKYYFSEYLENLWNRGYVSVGNVTQDSAAYVARYVMKKMTGDKAKDHYQKTPFDHETGEVLEPISIAPEYNRMSNRPAIGKEWYEQFKNDVYKQVCHINGKEYPIPYYYLKLMKLENPKKYAEILEERTQYAKDNERNEYQLNVLKNKYNHKFQNDRKLK